MKLFLKHSTVALTTAIAANSIALAEQTAAPQWSAEYGGSVEAGYEYDSTLNVADLDQSSASADNAALLKAGLDAKWRYGATTLSAGYDYSNRNYADSDSFDVELNQFSADLSHNFAPVTVGINYHYADAQLDDKALLDIRQSSLYASKLFDNRVLLRGAVIDRSKQFDERVERNANAIGGSFDGYLFSNDAKRYLALGYTVEEEDATIDSLDFVGHSGRLTAANKFTLFDRDNQVKLQFKYGFRDYTESESELGFTRVDEKADSSLAWITRWTNAISTETKVSYGDYNSNLATANYDETLVSFGVKAEF